jgi:hypothetical protein
MCERHAVKMIAEYLENAQKFERMAADEENPKIKAQFEKQAQAIASWRRRGRKSWACSLRLQEPENPRLTRVARPLTRETAQDRLFPS